ncbi:hypothetical protein DK128_18945, partial [Vibrio cholerae O1 biovar El Tor]|nr:hypothetical protein [Vibrio cholerae O1 biovar El Tor]
DSFFGSGSTLIAANNLSRKYIGCDISSSAHEYFKNRALKLFMPNKRLKRDCQRVAFPVPMSHGGYSCCV